MGIWLGFISWGTVGPISIGFMVGASIIDSGATVSWGFWISMTVLLVALLLNIIAPEVRRSAFRRSVAELVGAGGKFSRVVRGEVKMHLDTEGPYWWGEEVIAGLRLSGRMVTQPGFFVLSVYTGWVYAQYSLVLLVSLKFMYGSPLLTWLAAWSIDIEELPLQGSLGRPVHSCTCYWCNDSDTISTCIVLQPISHRSSTNGQLHHESTLQVVFSFHSPSAVHDPGSDLCRRICQLFLGTACLNRSTVCHGWPCWILHNPGYSRMLRSNHGSFRHDRSTAGYDRPTYSCLSR